jgi:hypothetical protein
MPGPDLLPSRPPGPAPLSPRLGPCRKCRQQTAGSAWPETHRTLLIDGRHQPDGHRARCTGLRVRYAGEQAPRNPARRPGWIGSSAPAMLSLRAMLSLGPGEAAGQLTNVVNADQSAHGRVVWRRHCPVIAGCAAAPEPPPRVLAPERRKFGIPVVPARPGVHGGRRQVAGTPWCCGRRARAWMAASAMQLPPPGGIRGAGQPGIRRRAQRAGARSPPVRPADHRADGRVPATRSDTSGSLIARPRPGPLRGRVRVTRDPPRARVLLSFISGRAPRGMGRRWRSCPAAPRRTRQQSAGAGDPRIS